MVTIGSGLRVAGGARGDTSEGTRGTASVHSSLWLLGIALLAASSQAATNEVRSVVDGAAGWATNAAARVVVAACQPCPVGASRSASYLNRSGFLSAFVMFPALDNDHDGRCDEDDPDDDNDGLADTVELSGAAFTPASPTDPMRADSDGDGMNDGAEAATGSNPLDPGSLLRILSIHRDGPRTRIAWQGRGGRTYALEGAGTLPALATNAVPLATVTAVGGAPPWFDTQAIATNATGAAARYYRVTTGTK